MSGFGIANKNDWQEIELYSPEAMVELILAHPQFTHAKYAAHFGKNESWFSAVLASEQFQKALAPHKHNIADPSLTATMDERFRALALRSVMVLQEKLNSPGVSDIVVLQAAALGVKALGLGQNLVMPVAVVNAVTSTETVAERLLAAMDRRDKSRTIDVQAIEVNGK